MHDKYDKIGDITSRTIEECSELIKELCKIQRFGWMDYHPSDKLKTPNWDRALNELLDVERRLKELKILIEEKFGADVFPDMIHSNKACHYCDRLIDGECSTNSGCVLPFNFRGKKVNPI